MLRFMFIVGIAAAMTGCSTRRGLMVAVGGGNGMCCLMVVGEQGSDLRSAHEFRCITADGRTAVLHEDCACVEQCQCWGAAKEMKTAYENYQNRIQFLKEAKAR